MRTLPYATSIAAAVLGVASVANAQILASDDFDYTGALTDNGWIAHSGAGNKVQMSNGMFATLDQSGGSGEDVNLEFDAQGAMATTYASFQFRVQTADLSMLDGNGLYFAHLKDMGFGFRARFGVVVPASGGDFGVAINGSASSLGSGTAWPTDLSFDTWYTAVINFDAVTGESDLWIDPVDETSASVSHVGASTGTDINSVVLRQSNDYTGLIDIDTVRAGGNFCDVIPTAFDTDLGAALGVTGDDSMTNVTLGFAFPFPDGTSHSSVDIDSNGRIVPAGLDTSDFSESVGELLAQATSICAYWDDLTPSGDIFFRTDASVAVITWVDTVRFFGSVNFTVQCQLYPNGRIVFCYDDRIDPGNDALVAISAGNGATDPGAADLRRDTAGGTSIYQQFAAGEFNLTDGCVSFTPDGMGGYCISDTLPTLPPPNIPGTVARLGKPCDATLDFQPDGTGGYNVSKIPAMWIDDTALSPVELAAGGLLGDDALTPVLALGHGFPGPNGTTWTDIRIDNNAVIHDGAGSEISGDFSASSSDLRSADAKIAVFWCDLSSQNGSLRMATDAAQTVITWDAVPQFAETNALTFQAVLNADGSFQLNYRETSTFDTSTGSGDNVLVGVSQGGGATDPGEISYADYPFMTAGDATIYSFFDGPTELPSVQPRIYSTATPELGGTLELTVEGISTVGISKTILFGFSNPNIPLDAIGGFGCTLLSSNEVPVLLSPVSGLDTYSLALPLNPGFVGLLNLHFQAAYIAPETNLGIVLTEGLHVFF